MGEEEAVTPFTRVFKHGFPRQQCEFRAPAANSASLHRSLRTSGQMLPSHCESSAQDTLL